MNQDRLKQTIEEIYGRDGAEAQMTRYAHLTARFTEEFGACEPRLFRAPGRTEIGGNHTDHQHGQVLAAAIDLDIAAAAAPADDEKICVFSEGFGRIVIDLRRPYTADEKAAEQGTAAALVRGMTEVMKQRGYCVSGFNVYAAGNVPEGSGLSSSAAFEVLIGVIISGLFNDGSIPPEEIAHIAQTAENDYYGKPCGLMDQMASATGGLCRIDFRDPDAPAVEKLAIDFRKMGYRICITNTHGSHAGHTADYAAVQTDLAKAASVFGKAVLEGVSAEDVIGHAAEIREAGGDRAFLRALHVASENNRVLQEAGALKQQDMTAFLAFVRRSGESSYKLLQNVYAGSAPEKQELAVALAVSEAVLKHISEGVCRVHGGGFAGTIQAFVEERCVDRYIAAMDAVFGEGSCFCINISQAGSREL